MTAPNVGGSDNGVHDAMVAYAASGLSVIPLAPQTKKPYGLVLDSGSWAPYQKRIATPDELQKWRNLGASDMGVGIICGQVSGGLYCLDVDHAGFATFLEATLSPYDWHGMWVVRSGSGLLHLYLRSQNPVYTTNIVGNVDAKLVKLADVRGDGQGSRGASYMAAPPTVHPSGTAYRTLAGSYEHIKTVPDAFSVFTRLKDLYAGSVTVQNAVADVQSEDDLDTGDKRIVRPDDDAVAVARERLSQAKLSRKVRKALAEGAKAGEGAWAGAPSNSEIDYRVLQELRANGFSIDDIEVIVATSPLGRNCYANLERGNHGRGYLVFSIGKIDREAAEAKTAAQQAGGDNFVVQTVTRVGYEDPVYECVVLCTDTQTRGTVHLRVPQLMSERQFKEQVMREMNFVPRLPAAFRGPLFEGFGSLVGRMAGQEAVPQAATTTGYLRGAALMVINREIDPNPPDDDRMVRVGWRNGTSAYLRGAAVLQQLQAIIRPAPKPEHLWAVLRAMGGEEEGFRWPSGRRESLWVLPLGQLDG